MHTVIVLIIGFALLAACIYVGRFLAGPDTLPEATVVFVALWFVGSLVNGYVGVVRAGYSVFDEVLPFLIVFGLPTAVAMVLRHKFS